MKERIRHIVAMVFAFVCSLGGVSCSPEAVDGSPDDGRMQVNIGLRVPLNPQTGDGFEEGSMYENYIDVAGGKYRIYFFDTNNRFIARFLPSGVVAEEGKNYVNYTVQGEVPEGMAIYRDFKVVMLANWPDYEDGGLEAGVTTIEDLCNADWAQFSWPGKRQLGPDNLIPFYGVHEYKDVTFEMGEPTVLSEPVTLLRALAKVEVVLEYDTETLEIPAKSTTYICRFNDKGYCAPSGVYSQNDYGQGTDWKNDYLDGLHLIGGKNQNGATVKRAEFWRTSGEAGKVVWVIYLTEYQNKGVEYEYSYVEIDLGEEGTYNIYFAEYTGGVTDNDDAKRLDIMRNNLYRFKVRLKLVDRRIEAEVSDWDEEYENDFNF